ncbi:MAG: VanW family protein [Bacillota bacterium]|nr:VanW family protein [Bacillota bacterium]
MTKIKAFRVIILCIIFVITIFSIPGFDQLKRAEVTKNSSITATTAGITGSGPTAEVPWTSDEAFKKAQTDNGTPVMMAGYKTVLRDPLPGEEYNVHLAARLLAGKVIQPGQVFSQNGQIGPYNEEKGFQKGPTYIGSQLTTTVGGGVCKIASTLYNVTILSNLQIVERHAHSMPVPYVPYGQDATVAYGARDFKFRNDTQYPIMIWAQGVENTLYIAFYGKEQPDKVEWHHEVLGTEKAPVVQRKSPELPSGSTKQVLEGMDGATVKSWITVLKPDGTVTVKNLGISSYRPMAYIVEVGI